MKHTIRYIAASVVAVSWLILIISRADAAPIGVSIDVSGTGGTVTDFYDGNMTFVSFGNNPLGSILVQKEYTDVSALTIESTYSALHSGSYNGFIRWTELIVNNTGFAWDAFTIELSGTTNPYFFNGEGLPGLATIDPGSPPGTLPSIEFAAGVGTVNIFGDPTPEFIQFDFTDPISPGESFGAHITIRNLAGGTAPYTFTLVQTPRAVPEPGTLALLGIGLLGLGFLRRQRMKSY